jgi:uncharacterized protein (TIGR00255 family)
MPPELDTAESAMRKAISAKVLRGHLDIRVQLLAGKAAGSAQWNRPLMEAYLQAFREASAEYGLSDQPDLNAAFRIPGMLSSNDEDAAGELPSALAEMIDEALGVLNVMREKEGSETAIVLRGYGGEIASATVEMESLRGDVVPTLKRKLTERLSELLGATSIEPERIMQEAAILADRSDIGEELTRLSIHAARLAEILDEGGEIGKKLDFLLQEMQREANTTLSKSNGTGEPGRRIAERALRVKSLIEKIREQALNVE